MCAFTCVCKYMTEYVEITEKCVFKMVKYTMKMQIFCPAQIK